MDMLHMMVLHNNIELDVHCPYSWSWIIVLGSFPFLYEQ